MQLVYAKNEVTVKLDDKKDKGKGILFGAFCMLQLKTLVACAAFDGEGQVIYVGREIEFSSSLVVQDDVD